VGVCFFKKKKKPRQPKQAEIIILNFLLI